MGLLGQPLSEAETRILSHLEARVQIPEEQPICPHLQLFLLSAHFPCFSSHSLPLLFNIENFITTVLIRIQCSRSHCEIFPRQFGWLSHPHSLPTSCLFTSFASSSPLFTTILYVFFHPLRLSFSFKPSTSFPLMVPFLAS